jgi:RNA polymerase sigma factor (sigma-70 family)
MTAQPFEEVVTAHGPTVTRVCRSLLGAIDAEDAWAETFLAALEAYPGLRPDSNLRGWLVTIAYRKSIDQIRRSQRAPTPLGTLPQGPASEAVDPAELDDSLSAALAALPSKQQRAVIFHYVAGLPYAEVARLMEISTVAARRNAADGIATLRTTYTKGTRHG